MVGGVWKVTAEQADWNCDSGNRHPTSTSLEGYRRTGGLEQSRQRAGVGGSQVWKVTAEQADWKYTTTPKPHQIHRLGRLPPNRRIGTSISLSTCPPCASLEGYRRTGGLELSYSNRAFLCRRVWKVTAVALRTHKCRATGGLEEGVKCTGAHPAPGLEGYRRTGGLEERKGRHDSDGTNGLESYRRRFAHP